MVCRLSLFSCLLAVFVAGSAFAGTFSTDFDAGEDSFGSSSGVLVFNGTEGFTVTFDDDGSDATDGVEITNSGPGNLSDGGSDLELGSNNAQHTSGIVASFNLPATSVSLFDNDDDQTAKTLFAFDALGNLIGQDGSSPYPGVPPGVFNDPNDSQRTFTVDLSITGGQLIYSVEFDTLPGTGGGASDGTFFTIDDFTVDFVPEPNSLAIFLTGSLALAVIRRR